MARTEQFPRALDIAPGAKLHLQIACPVMAQAGYIPSEPRHEVDRFRVYLEVDEDLAPLGRAHAGEVPQTLIRPVLLAIHSVDAVSETEQHLVDRVGHFERRKVSIGACGRAFGTSCIHEHACVRCPMLWPDPAQREQLVEIRDNLLARIAEAEREGWLGEVEGLNVSLAGAEEKLAQLGRNSSSRSVVDLDFPVISGPDSSTCQPRSSQAE
ncbi:hypothetical protein AQJ27_01010 [Streptomyces olivochromogenes]|nr:hypothetical protein AQJ27_01010 [Streptomyces olivochromogenes]